MKKLWYSLLVIVILLIVTNPKLSDFKDYRNSNYIGETSERESNLFVCSFFKKRYVYLIDNGVEKHVTTTYVGVIGNFFLMKNIKEK